MTFFVSDDLLSDKMMKNKMMKTTINDQYPPLVLCCSHYFWLCRYLIDNVISHNGITNKNPTHTIW